MNEQTTRIIVQLGIGAVFSLTDFIVRLADENRIQDPSVDELRETQRRHRELRTLPEEPR